MFKKIVSSIFKSKKNQPNNKAWINQCDFTEIFRPELQSEKPPITVTTITFLLLQATTDAYESRSEGIKIGLIGTEMNNNQAISAQLAFYVFSGFEEQFSPKLVLSFLDNYCLDEIKENFIIYYINFANRYGLSYKMNNFDNYKQFDAIMDIEGISKEGSRLNLKVEHNPFKEPYRSIWIKNFNKS